MKNESKIKTVATSKDKTVGVTKGGTRSLGVKNDQLKELGRNRAKIANQFGRSK